MSYAIGIKVRKADEKYDLSASKFFGTPTVPLAWETDFDEDEIFFCQIRLSDLVDLDHDNRLPHSGYLYVFLHTNGGEYGLKADVRYYDGEPEMALDGFNAVVDGYEMFDNAYLMEFYPTDEVSDCTHLLGLPSDWNYEEEAPKLLMQFDPLDSHMGFLDHLDGFVYFSFGKDESDFESVTVLEEYS